MPKLTQGYDTLQMTMLFDFFSDLLTEKQRDYFDLYYNEDLSLSEIAERAGISRQGVHDIITRAEKSLAEIEDKTGVVKKWLDMDAQLREAGNIARELLRMTGGEGEYAVLVRRMILAIEGMTDPGGKADEPRLR